MIDVDWSSLMPKQKQEPRTPGAALLRFTPGAVLLRAGVSRRLAGPQLLARVKEVCSRELEDPKGKCANLSLKECSSLKQTGHSNIQIFRKCTRPQAIQVVDEFNSWEQIWRTLALQRTDEALFTSQNSSKQI